MQIRKFTEKDTEEASNLICTTLRKVTIKGSPLFAIEEQCGEYSPEEIKKLSKKREIYVAVQNNEVIGTAAIDRDYIGSVFVDSSNLKKGIGSRLMDYIESIARKRGYKEVVLRSSPIAFGFYKKLGYKEVKRKYQRSQLTMIEMKKEL